MRKLDVTLLNRPFLKWPLQIQTGRLPSFPSSLCINSTISNRECKHWHWHLSSLYSFDRNRKYRCDLAAYSLLCLPPALATAIVGVITLTSSICPRAMYILKVGRMKPHACHLLPQEYNCAFVFSGSYIVCSQRHCIFSSWGTFIEWLHLGSLYKLLVNNALGNVQMCFIEYCFQVNKSINTATHDYTRNKSHFNVLGKIL